jgi:cytochrome c oxidase subunit 1/cytochrome c oxidase subunit I+III
MTDATANGDLAHPLAEEAQTGPYPPTEAMLAEPVDPAYQKASADRLREIWKQREGFRYWTAVNNSEVGTWYSLTAFGFMLCAGLLALGMRLQLAFPESDLLSASTYNQFMTMHGSAMMFLFAVPLFEAVSILILPAFLGARDMPFPRLSAYGYWCFLIGGVFVLGSVLFGVGPEAGWFMYPPLATDGEGYGPDIWLLGLSFIEVASIAAAVELIVGVLKCRPPGMRINLMPLYAWYVLVVGGMIIFAFPPLIAGDFLFELERSFDWPFFDPGRGGDPLLWQHLFWIFGHPEVYIIFLPSIAIAAMIIPTAAQRPIVGYSWIVLSAVGTGFISFGLWVHHMFTTGLPLISLGYFSAASEAVVIPTGVQLFAFLATLMVGSFQRSVPMLFIAGALAVFTAGGLSGVMVAVAAFDWQVHDSYFIVAHLHYVILGGVVLPVMAGAYYFYPFFTKKLMSPRLGRTVFWLVFTGINVTFLPMHYTGLMGMPRRVFTYPADLGWDIPNLISTCGAFLIAAGFAVFLYDLFRPGKPATPRNPWNAGTLEWTHDVPEDPGWGVRSIPYVTSRYPLWDQPELLERMDAGRYYLPDAEEGKRETLVTTVLDARPIQCLRVGGNTWMTHLAAIATAGAFILPVYHMWFWSAVSAVFAVGFVIWWLWTGTSRVPEKEQKYVGLGLTLPIYVSGAASPGWWGMWITMLADSTAFASLVFGFFYYWTANPQLDFPPPGLAHATLWILLPGAGLVAGAWGLTLFAREANASGRVGTARMGLAGAVAACLAGGALMLFSAWHAGMDPTAHVYPAIVWAILIWTAFHIAAGAIMLLYCMAGSFFGKMTPRHDADIWNVSLFWHFLLATVLVTALVTGPVARMM